MLQNETQVCAGLHVLLRRLDEGLAKMQQSFAHFEARLDALELHFTHRPGCKIPNVDEIPQRRRVLDKA